MEPSQLTTAAFNTIQDACERLGPLVAANPTDDYLVNLLNEGCELKMARGLEHRQPEIDVWLSKVDAVLASPQPPQTDIAALVIRQHKNLERALNAVYAAIQGTRNARALPFLHAVYNGGVALYAVQGPISEGDLTRFYSDVDDVLNAAREAA